MRKLFSAILLSNMMVLTSCNDGDIITVELDFSENFKVCDSGNDLVFFKTKNDPSESLSLRVASRNLESIIAVDEFGVLIDTINITAANVFNYRTYSNTTLPDNIFCNAVPNAEVNITQDIETTSGKAVIETILSEDDDDGIPANLEDINGNGNLEDDDTDGDGVPNYIDADDDGDNVLTKDENPNPDGDADLSDAQDTDADGIPDYLDPDDDGDGIDTRDEENDSQNLNPKDDVTVVGAPDYLNINVANRDTPAATAYREHIILQNYNITLNIFDIDLEILSIDSLDFGILENAITTESRKITPEFP